MLADLILTNLPRLELMTDFCISILKERGEKRSKGLVFRSLKPLLLESIC